MQCKSLVRLLESSHEVGENMEAFDVSRPLETKVTKDPSKVEFPIVSTQIELKAELVKFKKGFLKSIQIVKLCLLKEALQYTRMILNKAGEHVNTRDEFTIPFDEIIGITKKTSSSSNPLSVQSLQIHTMSEVLKGCTGCKNVMKRIDYQFQCIRVKENNEKAVLEFANFCKTLAHVITDNRPKELAVIINPIGGKHNARQQWLNKAKPLFTLAKIHFQEYETQHSNHAFEIAAQLDIQHLDGIVCVGGDGLFNEIINGLMSRKDKEKAIQIPIGLIPAGSQNALAVSCAGTVDPIKHTLWIIKGYKRPLDLVSVNFKPKRSSSAANERTMEEGSLPMSKYSAVVVAFGLLGEVGQTCEKYRWMGPSRYIWCGGKRLLSPLFYKCKISYLPADVPEWYWNEFHEENVPPPEFSWQQLDEEVFNLLVFNVSGANTQTPAVIPTCDPSDGAMSVCVWRKCTRANIVNYLLRQYSGNHVNLDFIHIFKAKALRFEPISDCPINIDGEIFPCGSFELNTLPSAATLMCPKFGLLSRDSSYCL